MTKQTGLGDRFFLSGYNLSGDINSASEIGGGPAALDLTDITQAGYGRAGGELGGRMTVVSFFDDAAGASHTVLKTLPTSDVIGTWLRGTGIGSPGACLQAVQVNYDPQRANDGGLLFTTALQSDQYPLEWGEQLTAGVRTDTTATSPATGLDGLASTTFGGQAYLHVFSVTGTSCTVTLQDSADNATFANITGGAFTAVNAGSVSVQRLALTGTQRRYTRAITTGTFSNAQFAVVYVRNQTAITY